MSIDKFFEIWNGQFADYDGMYGNQCVDIINFYQRDVIQGEWIGTPVTGGARDWFENYPNSKVTQKYYERITNDKSDPNQLPQKGDVIVWGANASNKYGHIAIVKSADSSGFTSFDQNWPLGSPCHFVNHNWTGVLGWLRPRKFITVNGGTMITRTGLNVLYRFLLGTTPSEYGLKNRLGKQTFDQAYKEILTSTTYRNKVTNKDIAINNHLPIDIRNLNIPLEMTKELSLANHRVTELTKAISIKDNEITRLKALAGNGTKWENLKVLLRELLGIK